VFCSSVIATIGRTSLTQSVESVLAQSFEEEDYEVIVVNDSGQPLPAAAWQKSDRVRILHTRQRERCFARNAGAAIARGRYLHFLDDDDWLLPGALAALYSVARTTAAGWIYGTTRFLDQDKNLLTDHHVRVSGNGFLQAVGGEWIPLQASLIRSDAFFEVGGFDPRFTVCQDKDLCRKILFRFDIANTNALIACIFRDRRRSTTNYELATAYSIWSRDDILAQNGAFSRMRRAVTDSYWCGRLVRSYLTCIHWNLRHGRILSALERGLHAAAGFAIAGRHLLSADFWSAILHPHSRKNVY